MFLVSSADIDSCNQHQYKPDPDEEGFSLLTLILTLPSLLLTHSSIQRGTAELTLLTLVVVKIAEPPCRLQPTHQPFVCVKMCVCLSSRPLVSSHPSRLFSSLPVCSYFFLIHRIFFHLVSLSESGGICVRLSAPCLSFWHLCAAREIFIASPPCLHPRSPSFFCLPHF